MKSGRHWPLIIVGFLLLAVTANGILVFLAIGNPSFAVESDFYQKAVDWDKKRDQDRRNLELGWELELLPLQLVPDDLSEIEVRLHDSAGHAIEGATVALDAFHLARAAEIQKVTFREDSPGRYVSKMRLQRVGLWEFRFTVAREDVIFTDLVQASLDPLQ